MRSGTRGKREKIETSTSSISFLRQGEVETRKKKKRRSGYSCSAKGCLEKETPASSTEEIGKIIILFRGQARPRRKWGGFWADGV